MAGPRKPMATGHQATRISFQWLGTKLAPRHRSQESNGSNGPSNGRAPGNQGNQSRGYQWLSPMTSIAGWGL